MTIFGINIWFILAQLMGIGALAFEFASYQIKDKSKYFRTTGIGSAFWAVMFVCIGLSTGMATQVALIVAGVYSTIRNFVFYFTFKINTVKSNEFGLRFLLVMIVIAVVAGIIAIGNAPAEVRWLQIFSAIGAVAFVIGQYAPGVHGVRIAVVFYAIGIIMTQSPLNILEGDIRWNFMGIAIELAKIISVVVFYVRFAKEPEKPALAFAKV